MAQTIGLLFSDGAKKEIPKEEIKEAEKSAKGNKKK